MMSSKYLLLIDEIKLNMFSYISAGFEDPPPASRCGFSEEEDAAGSGQIPAAHASRLMNEIRCDMT